MARGLRKLGGLRTWVDGGAQCKSAPGGSSRACGWLLAAVEPAALRLRLRVGLIGRLLAVLRVRRLPLLWRLLLE